MKVACKHCTKPIDTNRDPHTRVALNPGESDSFFHNEPLTPEKDCWRGHLLNYPLPVPQTQLCLHQFSERG